MLLNTCITFSKLVRPKRTASPMLFKHGNILINLSVYLDLKLREGVNLGLDASEHMYYVFKACSAKEDSITHVIQAREHTDKPIGLFRSEVKGRSKPWAGCF